MRIEDADERDNSWETYRPRYRVYLYEREDDEAGSLVGFSGVTAFDVVDADLSEAIAAAEHHAGDHSVYSLGVVIDEDDYSGPDDRESRGIVWLTGYDFNTSQPDFGSPSRLAALRRFRGTHQLDDIADFRDHRDAQPRV